MNSEKKIKSSLPAANDHKKGRHQSGVQARTRSIPHVEVLKRHPRADAVKAMEAAGYEAAFSAPGVNVAARADDLGITEEELLLLLEVRNLIDEPGSGQ